MNDRASARLLLAVESFSPGNGGICRVARLVARAISEEMSAGRLQARSIALNDSEAASGIGLPINLARGSRLRFVWEVYKAALHRSHFFYDFLGMARAHCHIPGLRKPFMTWIHGIEIWENARSDRLKWARRADLILCNSDYTRRRAVRAHGNLDGARVCWLATEADEAPPTRVQPVGSPTVLMLGRFDEIDRYKGHRELIACWPRVAACLPEARLLFIGRGPGKSRIERLAADSPAHARIEFRGFVPDSQLDSVWAESSIFAMPSRGEGFGLVYVEAMRQGIPVVASVHDAAPEINIDGVTGFNVDLDKPDQLSDRLIFLLKNPAQAAQLGRNGRERWWRHFRFSCFKERFLPLLREFLK